MKRMMFKALSMLLILTLCAGGCAGAFAEESGKETTSAEHANAYVFVITATQGGWLPLPDTKEGEYSYTLEQQLEDGTTIHNIVHVTVDGFYMESADCEGQDCVNQGTVTLENVSERVLGNMVVCLPHQVTLMLYTWDEIQKMMAEQ